MPKPGPDKALCGAQLPNKPQGVTCKLVAGHKTEHLGVGRCSRHGGNTPSQTVAAQKQIAQEVVERRKLFTTGEPQYIDARDVIAEELWRTRCAVDVLEGLVNDLGLDEGGLYSKTYHVSGLATGEAKPHVLWVMLMEERKHLRGLGVDAAKAGVEARRMELDEMRAKIFVMLLRATATDPELSLDADKQRVLLRVAAKHLRALPEGS